MPCIVQKITPEDWKTSLWSGGKTNEIVLFPADGDYSLRRFSWRISSATVDNEESDFTPLPGFSRFISTLDQPITLTHDDSSFVLYPGAVHFFSGAEFTHSVGKCSDFNLIFNPDVCDCSMQALGFTKASPVFLESVFGKSDTNDARYVLFCKEGNCTLDGTSLQKHDTLVLTEITDCKLMTDDFCELFFIKMIHNR